MEQEMVELLDHVPMLVRAYGKWPSFIYLVFVTLLRPRLFFVISAAYFAAHHY
ncbi:hypothetical protein V1282_006960 [Nitrobacteraceae bacterium AZCC 2146]